MCGKVAWVYLEVKVEPDPHWHEEAGQRGAGGAAAGPWRPGVPHAPVPPAATEGPTLRTDLTLCGLKHIRETQGDFLAPLRRPLRQQMSKEAGLVLRLTQGQPCSFPTAASCPREAPGTKVGQASLCYSHFTVFDYLPRQDFKIILYCPVFCIRSFLSFL